MGIHTCETCSKTFTKYQRLIEHRRIHTGERPFKCFVNGCNKTFVREYHLKRHKLTHSGEKPFRCTFEGCEKTFALQHNQKRHQERAHNRPFKCDVPGCGLSFKKSSKLVRHKGMHESSKPCSCTFAGCSFTCTFPSRLQTHLKVHEKVYKCSAEDCNTTFRTWSELVKHSVTHKQKVKCQECDKLFNSKHELRNHKVVHLATRTVFVCPEDGCNRQYVKKYGLECHIRSYHRNEKPFVCVQEGCGKSFCHKVSLNSHMDTHKPSYQLKNSRKEKKKRKKKSLAAKLARYKKNASLGKTQNNASTIQEGNATLKTTVDEPSGKNGVIAPTVASHELTSQNVSDDTSAEQPQMLVNNEQGPPKNIDDDISEKDNSSPEHLDTTTINSMPEYKAAFLVQCAGSS